MHKSICLLVFIALLTAPVSGQSARSFESALWNVSYNICIDNSSAQQGYVELTVPFITDEKPYQEIISSVLPPSPMRRYRDLYGNQCGTWKIRILPGERVSLPFTYTVKTCHVRHEMMKGQTRKDCAGNTIPGFPALPVKSHPSIGQRAREIHGGERSPYYRALKIYDHIMTRYRFNSDGKRYGIPESLGQKTIQCSDAALLYTALARASAIPARCAGGLYITPGKVCYSTFHSWSEVCLNGRDIATVDPTLGRFNATSRLRCFFERRIHYMTFWKGLEEPFTVHYLPGSAAPMNLSFLVMVTPGDSCNPSAGSLRGDPGLSHDVREVKKWRDRASAAAGKACGRGRALQRKALYDKAAREYIHAACISPDFFEPVRALLALRRRGVLNEEIEGFFRKRAAKSSSDSLASYALGEIEREKEHYSAARDAYERAEESGFISGELYGARMRLFSRTRETEAFDEALSRWLSMKSVSLELYEKALLFYMSTESWERCINLAAMGEKDFPSSHLFPAVSGYAYMHLGSCGRALSLIDRALQREPDMGWYHCIRGWILLKMGNRKEARKEIERGIRLGKGVDNPAFFRNLLNEP